VRAKLDKLPDPITGNPQFELNCIVRNCASAIEKEVNGDKLNLWLEHCKIRRLDRISGSGKSEFNLDLGKTEPLKEITEADIQCKINDTRGRQLPGFISYSVVSESIKDFQEKWKNSAFHCLSNTHGIMSKAVEESIEARFDRCPLLVGLMKHNAIKWLEECKKETLGRLKFNMLMESFDPFTMDEGSMFEGKNAYLAALQEAIRKDNHLIISNLSLR
ncbi:4223_t:CDS:2, partial [Ambispora gerdemannii]